MKIKFLGTSAGWPLPRLGCKCNICLSSDPKDTRTRTQILVNSSILLDAGPDTYRHLINEYVGKVKAVLVSHQHPDHTLGFWDLTHIYNGYRPIEIITPQAVINGIKQYVNTHAKNIKFKAVKPNQPFSIDNVKVEYFPVIHGKTPAFGIKLKDGKIFTYITDFNKILPSQEKMVKYSHVLAIDGSSLGKIGQGPGHISINDGIELSKRFKIKNTYFIHIGHKTATHNFLEDYLKENAGKNFHAAYDGLEIVI